MTSNPFKRKERINLVKNVHKLIQQNSKNISNEKLNTYYYFLGWASANFDNKHTYNGLRFINKILSNLISDSGSDIKNSIDTDLFNSFSSLLNNEKKYEDDEYDDDDEDDDD